jgi:hypothetical protein
VLETLSFKTKTAWSLVVSRIGIDPIWTLKLRTKDY